VHAVPSLVDDQRVFDMGAVIVGHQQLTARSLTLFFSFFAEDYFLFLVTSPPFTEQLVAA